ncbi:CDP-alcohol phosphatidyltransferase-domain-containing protein [Tuber borchii]|uniref:CDP-alcohol phosphatidyltransferase-domain-containing protein n=1 Tax=Tuber borchii TaxID=42251 RepID=A0A2T6ZUL7_TUBBO|nr:CDP-alcohol phosphatidyltransferase-domain-containing protein [Tuber borchii]
MLGRQQLVPSGVRAPVHRRSVMTMGLNDGKKGVLLIAGSRYAARSKNHTATTNTTTSAPVKKRRKILPITPHEDIYNIPNLLTFSRLLASPVIGYLVLQEQHAAALALFVAAGLTDLADGYLARRWNLKTVVGSVIDPMADKTLMTILTVTLAMKGLLPVWLASIILGRDVGLAMSAIYFRWISLPPPKTMTRYWDFSLPSAEVHPTTISKLNTALQLGLIGACMAHPFMITMGPYWDFSLRAMQYTVATTTIWSGLSYVFSKDAVRILKQPQEPEDEAGSDDDKKKMT